jgi:uncharacterized protein (UPF0333 family)
MWLPNYKNCIISNGKPFYITQPHIWINITIQPDKNHVFKRLTFLPFTKTF